MKWILLRGWAREARHWGRFPEELRAALPDTEVRAIDLPGSGRLCERKSPAAVPAIVDQLRALHVEPGDARHYLLGLSLGAMVCIDWALRYPDEVAGGVLLNTSLRPFSAFHERLRPGVYATILRTALFQSDAVLRESAILRMTSATCSDATLPAAWAAYAEERPVSRANVLRQLVAAARYSAPLAPPPAPLLILASERDRLVNLNCSRRLAQAWNARIAIHPRAGHDLTLDDGAWVARQIQQWLRRI